MVIELLADYRGVLTGEEYYTAGQYDVPGMMPLAHAENLTQAGRAVIVTPKPSTRRVSSKKRGSK